MLALPELQLQRVLKTAFAAIKADDTLLRDLFMYQDAEFVTEVVTFFSKQERVIPVRLGWPREGVEIPSINIVNSGDSEDVSKDTLGQFLEEEIPLPTDDDAIQYDGVAKRGTYQILCLATDPREALYIQLVLESLLILNLDTLVQGGLHEISYNSGDLRFEEQLFPAFSNSRVVTVSCLHYHAVPKLDRFLNTLIVTVTPVTVTLPEE